MRQSVQELSSLYDFIKREERMKKINALINRKKSESIDIYFNEINKHMRLNLMNGSILRCEQCLHNYLNYNSSLICCNQIYNIKNISNNININLNNFLNKFGNHYINMGSNLMFLRYELPNIEEGCDAIAVINHSTLRIYNLYGLELIEAMEMETNIQYELYHVHNIYKILIKKQKKRFCLIMKNHPDYLKFQKCLNACQPIKKQDKVIKSKFHLKFMKKKFKKEVKIKHTITNYNFNTPYSIYKNKFLSTPNLKFHFQFTDDVSLRTSISSSESSQASSTSPVNLNIYFNPNLDDDITNILIKFPMPPPRY